MSNQPTSFAHVVALFQLALVIIIQYHNNNNNIIIIIIVCGVYRFMYTTVNNMYVHVVLTYLDDCCKVL